MKTLLNVFIIFVIVLWFCVFFLIGRDYGYYEGQKDALKGKYKYKIEVTQDTSYVIIQKP